MGNDVALVYGTTLGMGNIQGRIALDELYLQENEVSFSGTGNVNC